MPEITAYFQSGGLVDAVLGLGMPAPIDVQVAGSNLASSYRTGHAAWPRQIRKIDGVGDIYVPQDLDYPALQLDIDRTRAAELGLTQKEVVGNVITALTSNAMIAPSFWIDPKTGNDYMLTVQYPETPDPQFRRPARHSRFAATGMADSTRLDAISNIRRIKSPTEVDHYAASPRDRYLRAAAGRRPRPHRQQRSIDSPRGPKFPKGVTVTLRGLVQGMRAELPQLRHRAHALGGSALSDSGGAVPFLPRPAADPHRRAAGI